MHALILESLFRFQKISMDNLLDGFGDSIGTSDAHQASPNDREGDDYSFAHFDINDYVSVPPSAASMSTTTTAEQQQQQSLDHIFDTSNHPSMQNTPNSLVHDAFQQYHDQRGQGQPQSGIDLLSNASTSSNPPVLGHSNSLIVPHGDRPNNTGLLPATNGPGSGGNSTPSTSNGAGPTPHNPPSDSATPGGNASGVDPATERLREQLAKQLQLQHLQQLQNQLFQQQVRPSCLETH